MARTRAAVIASALVLVLAACSATPAAPSATTGGGATPAESDGAPTDAASGEAKTGSARIGIGGWSIAYVPTAITIDRLNEMGYDIEAIETAGTSAQMQAATQGELDITSVSAAATMTAIDAGLDSQFFLTRNLNEFLLVAKADIADCAGLDGKRVAIHAPTDITGLLTTNWLEENCPEAEPNIQIVEGSENRLAGLLQDQIDASPVDIGDWTQLNNERPGEFTVLAEFVEDYPVLQGVYAAPPEFLEENEGLIRDFISTHLDVVDEFYENPESVLPKAQELLPEIEEETLRTLLEQYAEAEIFPRDGDLSEEQTQLTLDFFSEAGGFENVGTFEDVADRSYLDAVLAER